MSNVNLKMLTTGEIIDLSKMNKHRLKRLHFEEEKYMAEKILKAKPFSNQRKRLMQEGYAQVNRIMPWYMPNVKISYGANENSTKIVTRLMSERSGNIVVYEAGVGTGFSCKKFLNSPNATIYGCDILIDCKVKELTEKYDKLIIHENTLVESLKKMEDNSIDFFYADNVFEHLLPDEFPCIMKLLKKKLKKDARVILIIPNRLVGPSDVSKYFVKKGKQAEGFHFMEMTQREMRNIFKRFNLEMAYYIHRNQFGECILHRKNRNVLNFFKIILESIVGLVVKLFGNDFGIFYKFAMDVYVFENRGDYYAKFA